MLTSVGPRTIAPHVAHSATQPKFSGAWTETLGNAAKSAPGTVYGYLPNSLKENAGYVANKLGSAATTVSGLPNSLKENAGYVASKLGSAASTVSGPVSTLWMDTSLQGRAIKASLLALGIIGSAVTYKLFNNNPKGALSAEEIRNAIARGGSLRKAGNLGGDQPVDKNGQPLFDMSAATDTEDSAPPTPTKDRPLTTKERRAKKVSIFDEAADIGSKATASASTATDSSKPQPAPSLETNSQKLDAFLARRRAAKPQPSTYTREETDDKGFISGEEGLGPKLSHRRNSRRKTSVGVETQSTRKFVEPDTINVPVNVLKDDQRKYKQAIARLTNTPEQLIGFGLKNYTRTDKVPNTNRGVFNPSKTVKEDRKLVDATFTFANPPSSKPGHKPTQTITVTMDRFSFPFLDTRSKVEAFLGTDLPTTFRTAKINGMDDPVNPVDLQNKGDEMRQQYVRSQK